MKAWFYKRHGGVEVLQFDEFPVPEINPKQVLVRVEAAALNPIDFKRRNVPFGPHSAPFPVIPGHDLAGVVVKVGDEVSKFKQGDPVYGDLVEFAAHKPVQFGSLAQYAAVDEKLLALKPEKLSFEEAASLPVAVETAIDAFDRAEFKAGQSVLVIGGAGGVGSLAIQLAKVFYGASIVDATSSTSKLKLLKSLGADTPIDYTKTSYEELEGKYDFVFDTIGEIKRAEKAAKPGGKAITIADREHPSMLILEASGEKLERLSKVLQSGELKAVLDPISPVPFSKVPEGFQHLETGRAIGKVVINSLSST